MATHACNTSAMEAETEGSLELPGQTDPLNRQWQTLSQKIRWKSDRGRQHASICSLLNIETHIHQHAPIHTNTQAPIHAH